MRSRVISGLYAITPEMADTPLLLRLVESAIAGGAAAVQYRAKQVSPLLAHEQACALVALCRRSGVPLMINDHVELALAVGADGVHIGRDDGSAATVRRLFPGAIVGVSCYDSLTLAAQAVAEGADYVAFGSFFSSATKPAAARASLSLLSETRSKNMPSVAIGGITPKNALALVTAGADAVAVISALFENADENTVLQRAREFSQLFTTCHA